jgi:hypothetical protein
MFLVGTGSQLLDLDTDRVIADFAVNALAPPFVLVDEQRVLRIDGTEIGALDTPDAQSVARLGDARALVGRTGARLAVVSSTAVEPLPAFEAVPGRDEWENPANPTPDTRTLAVDAGGRIFVNVHVGGLWCSNDGGTTWACVVEPDADIHEVVAADGRVVVAAAVGFGWSDDGTTWNWTTDGLHASYARAAAVDGDTFFVSASNGPFTRRGAVYRGRAGERFERCTTGLPEWFPGNIDSGALAAHDGRAAIGTYDGEVYASTDAGTTWALVADGLDPVRAVRFA